MCQQFVKSLPAMSLEIEQKWWVRGSWVGTPKG